jgi:hypothetical protein
MSTESARRDSHVALERGDDEETGSSPTKAFESPEAQPATLGQSIARPVKHQGLFTRLFPITAAAILAGITILWVLFIFWILVLVIGALL